MQEGLAVFLQGVSGPPVAIDTRVIKLRLRKLSYAVCSETLFQSMHRIRTFTPAEEAALLPWRNVERNAQLLMELDILSIAVIQTPLSATFPQNSSPTRYRS